LDDFKPTTLPNDEYDEHLHQNLPDLDEIWYDRDLMLAFREYLNQQLANESLSFYMDAVYIENFVQDDDLENKAKEIYDKYLGGESKVDLEYNVVSKIEKAIKKKNLCERYVYRRKTKKKKSIFNITKSMVSSIFIISII